MTIDSGEFRRVLGHFPTGVTVVTGDGDDGPAGMAIAHTATSRGCSNSRSRGKASPTSSGTTTPSGLASSPSQVPTGWVIAHRHDEPGTAVAPLPGLMRHRRVLRRLSRIPPPACAAE